MERKFDYKRAAENLVRYLKENPNEVVIHTTIKHVSKSGMSRDILAFVILNNEIYNLGFGRVNGGGMDMGYECAHNIFSTAYPELRYQDYFKHRSI